MVGCMCVINCDVMMSDECEMKKDEGEVWCLNYIFLSKSSMEDIKLYIPIQWMNHYL